MKWYRLAKLDKLAYGADNSLIDQGLLGDVQNGMAQPGAPAVPPHPANQPTHSPKQRIKPNKGRRGVLRSPSPVHRFPTMTNPKGGLPPVPFEGGDKRPEASGTQPSGELTF